MPNRISRPSSGASNPIDLKGTTISASQPVWVWLPREYQTVVPVHIPRRALLTVLQHVEENPVGVRREENRASAIVVGVDHHREGVVGCKVLAVEHRASQRAARVAVEAANSYIEVRVVEQNPHVRGLGRWKTFEGLALVQTLDRLYPAPRRVGHAAVDDERAFDRRRVHIPALCVEDCYPLGSRKLLESFIVRTFTRVRAGGSEQERAEQLTRVQKCPLEAYGCSVEVASVTMKRSNQFLR